MNAAPCSEGNTPRSKADSALVTAADHGSQSATGPIRKEKEQEEEKEEQEKEKRQAELRHAQGQLKKCLEDEDYRGAAVAKANMTALMCAAPCSQGNPPRSKAELAVAMASDQGLQSEFIPLKQSRSHNPRLPKVNVFMKQVQ